MDMITKIDRLTKIEKKNSSITNQYNNLLRNMEIVPLMSDLGKYIIDLWKKHEVEYGQIKYIIGYTLKTKFPEASKNQEMVESQKLSKNQEISTKSLDIKNKFHIICLKKTENNIKYYYSSWCIQVNI